MDFDFSTLIPIILAALYYVFSGAKKKNQQKRGDVSDPETIGPTPGSEKPTFEELLEEFTGAKRQEEARPAPEPKLELSPVTSKVTKVQETKAVRLVDVQNQESERLFQFDESDEENDPDNEDYTEMFQSLDGAKRAFVASEIFNRKY